MDNTEKIVSYSHCVEFKYLLSKIVRAPAVYNIDMLSLCMRFRKKPVITVTYSLYGGIIISARVANNGRTRER